MFLVVTTKSPVVLLWKPRLKT